MKHNYALRYIVNSIQPLYPQCQRKMYYIYINMMIVKD